MWPCSFQREAQTAPKVFAAEGNRSKPLNTSSKQKQFAFPTKVQGSEPRKGSDRMGLLNLVPALGYCNRGQIAAFPSIKWT